VSAGFVGGKVNEITQGSDFRLRLAQTYLILLVGGGLLTTLARRTFRTSIFAQILSANTFWLVTMLLPALIGGYLRDYGWLTSPAEALVGIALTVPLHYWLIKAGLERWVLALEGEREPARLNRLPAARAAGLLALSFALAFGSVLAMLKLYTGLPWRDVLLLIRGVYG
jgi:hypothetical protein